MRYIIIWGFQFESGPIQPLNIMNYQRWDTIGIFVDWREAQSISHCSIGYYNSRFIRLLRFAHSHNYSTQRCRGGLLWKYYFVALADILLTCTYQKPFPTFFLISCYFIYSFVYTLFNRQFSEAIGEHNLFQLLYTDFLITVNNSRCVQYVYCVMHTCIMVKIGGRKTRKLVKN